jgi:hypothetical protein
VIDLGAGTGALGAAIAERVPVAPGPAGVSTWSSIARSTTTSRAAMWLQSAIVRSLYGRIHTALRPGGTLVIGDCVVDERADAR